MGVALSEVTGLVWYRFSFKPRATTKALAYSNSVMGMKRLILHSPDWCSYITI